MSTLFQDGEVLAAIVSAVGLVLTVGGALVAFLVNQTRDRAQQRDQQQKEAAALEQARTREQEQREHEAARDARLHRRKMESRRLDTQMHDLVTPMINAVHAWVRSALDFGFELARDHSEVLLAYEHEPSGPHGWDASDANHCDVSRWSASLTTKLTKEDLEVVQPETSPNRIFVAPQVKFCLLHFMSGLKNINTLLFPPIVYRAIRNAAPDSALALAYRSWAIHSMMPLLRRCRSIFDTFGSYVQPLPWSDVDECFKDYRAQYGIETLKGRPRSFLFITLVLHAQAWERLLADWEAHDYSRLYPDAPSPFGILFYLIRMQDMLAKLQEEISGQSYLSTTAAESVVHVARGGTMDSAETAKFIQRQPSSVLKEIGRQNVASLSTPKRREIRAKIQRELSVVDGGAVGAATGGAVVGEGGGARDGADGAAEHDELGRGEDSLFLAEVGRAKLKQEAEATCRGQFRKEKDAIARRNSY